MVVTIGTGDPNMPTLTPEDLNPDEPFNQVVVVGVDTEEEEDQEEDQEDAEPDPWEEEEEEEV